MTAENHSPPPRSLSAPNPNRGRNGTSPRAVSRIIRIFCRMLSPSGLRPKRTVEKRVLSFMKEDTFEFPMLIESPDSVRFVGRNLLFEFERCRGPGKRISLQTVADSLRTVVDPFGAAKCRARDSDLDPPNLFAPRAAAIAGHAFDSPVTDPNPGFRFVRIRGDRFGKRPGFEADVSNRFDQRIFEYFCCHRF